MNVLIINGASQVFYKDSGKLNKEIEKACEVHLLSKENHVQLTHVDQVLDLKEEVEKWLWADLIIFHTPVWWFGLPYPFKGYLDNVFTEGQQRIYKNDGRSSSSPKLNYGKGGLLNSKYMLITTWNAPEETFTTPGELMYQRPPDEGVFYGFHKMCSFIGLEPIEGFHFYDVVKDMDFEKSMSDFVNHLERTL
ncbi:MAG: NAD(P)H-dependent oxidoreductase [Flavobacteriaceae bacterium]